MDLLAYAAGIIDGEGYIRKVYGVSKRCYSIAVKMTDLDVLEKLKQAFGVGQIYSYPPPTNPNHTQIHEWSVTNKRDTAHVLKLILPYLSYRRAFAAQNTLDAIDAC